MVTLEEVKTILQIENEDSDEAIKKLIPLVQDEITHHCNNTFEGTFPQNLKLVAIRIIGLNIHIPDDDYSIIIPDQIYKTLNKYRKLRWPTT